MTIKERARAYAGYFDHLSAENVGDLRELAHPDIRFKDPFNDITGVERVIGLMAHMFESTENPKFRTCAIFTDDRTCMIKWNFVCHVRKIGQLDFDGVSEIAFDAAGLVTSHIDYWDAGAEVYARVPVLGAAVRVVRNKLAYPD